MTPKAGEGDDVHCFEVPGVHHVEDQAHQAHDGKANQGDDARGHTRGKVEGVGEKDLGQLGRCCGVRHWGLKSAVRRIGRGGAEA